MAAREELGSITGDGSSTSYGYPTNGSEDVCGNSSVFTYYSEFSRSWTGAGVAEAAALAVVCAASLSTNAAVIYCALRHPSLRTTTNYFVVNLAAADAVFALTAPFVAAVRVGQRWMFSDWLCKLLPLAQLLCGSVLLWTLTVISIDRYRHVVSRVATPRFTARGALVVVAALWILPACLCVPVASYFRVVRVRPPPDAGLLIVASVCTLCYPRAGSRPRLAAVFIGIMIAALAVLPASIMSFNYYRICKKLRVANDFSRSFKMRARVVAADAEEEDDAVGEPPPPEVACRKCSQLLLDNDESPSNGTPETMSELNARCCRAPGASSETTEVVVEGGGANGGGEVQLPRRKWRRRRRRRTSGRVLALMKHEHNSRVVRLLIVDVLAVFLMWAPIWAILIAICVDSDDDASKIVQSHQFIYCLTVAYANSWLNAILYGVLNGNFRPYICYK